MPKIVKKSRVTKGKMARELVYYCLWALTAALAWAMVVKTAALLLDRTCDLSDVLVFAGAAFGGGELPQLRLLCRRIPARILRRLFADDVLRDRHPEAAPHVDRPVVVRNVDVLFYKLRRIQASPPPFSSTAS